ncbi:phage tail protein [Prescottella equi]|uniref:phage tail protein n=1 Tax=Rhodococcus hoagii TaxID=43767 RepID=UPI000D10177A|nr:phage tail protein [Prescottella equi]AVP71351.1 phage tail protein [Prescottella equi]
MAEAALIELDGVDGSHWTLSGPGMGSGGVEFATAPAGIYDAPVQVSWSSSAFEYGARPGVANWLKRDVTFAVNIFETQQFSWQDVDSAWRKAWSYEEDSTLSITTSYGTRRLKLRLTQQPEFKPDVDPHLRRSGKVTMICTAGVPWWVEDDVVDTWKSPVSTADGTLQIGSVVVSNPTDRPMWLQWVATAPGRWTLPDHSWNPDDPEDERYGAIKLPTLIVGQDVTVDTDPMEEMIVAADDSLVWARMDGQFFQYAVPPYTPPTRIPVAVTGAPAGAAVMVRSRRNWSRPWGLE